jgi:hypothetical protein
MWEKKRKETQKNKAFVILCVYQAIVVHLFQVIILIEYRLNCYLFKITIHPFHLQFDNFVMGATVWSENPGC